MLPTQYDTADRQQAELVEIKTEIKEGRILITDQKHNFTSNEI